MFLFSHGNVDTSSAIQFSFVFGLIGFIPFLYTPFSLFSKACLSIFPPFLFFSLSKGI